MKIKRLLITTVAALAVALGAATTSHAATAHDPILFVHGWHGDGSNWAVMIANFKADGWTDAELNTWTYNSSQSNTTTAAQIRDRVDSILAATGDSKVDIVTHSMGGLSSRYYIKNLGGDQKVDDWVSLAGPNHGTTRANSCIETSCVEMRPGSTFLNNLNAVDETPGLVNYGTWRSPCDEIIDPHDSVILSGATNTQTACESHLTLPGDPAVYQQVRDFVR